MRERDEVMSQVTPMDAPNHPLQPILVFDFETTGLDVRRDYAVALGWSVINREGRIFGPYEVILKVPRRAIFRYYKGEAYNMHKISMKTSREEGLTPREAVMVLRASVLTVLSDEGEPNILTLNLTKLAAQNIAFDYPFLKRLYEDARASFPFDYHCIDVPTLGYALTGIEGSMALADAFDIIVEETHRHSAAWDSSVTAQTLLKLLGQLASLADEGLE